jgi:hypothetical protein
MKNLKTNWHKPVIADRQKRLPAMRFWAEEKGAVQVVAAVGLTVILGFTALVTDVGLLQVNRASLVNSADAAALAGVQELPGNVAKARQEAEKYLSQNNPGDDFEISVSENNYRIDVAVNKEVNLVFGRFLGIDSSSVGASSAAAIGSVVGYQGILPFGIQDQEIVFYQQYQLKTGDGAGTTGTFGALALGGTGASVFRENTKHGYDQMVRVGDVLPIESGNMSGPVKQGLSYRVDQCTRGLACTAANPAPGCPKLLIIPVYEPYQWDKNKLKNVKVVGFAAFYVEQVPANGEIVGRFIRMVLPGEMGAGVVNNYGTLAARLIK